MAQMRLTVTHTGKEHEMECRTPQGALMTYSEGTATAGSPMQHLLAASGACALLDVEVILRKKRLAFSNLRVECVGERPDDVTPKPFLGITLVFRVDGDVPVKAFEDAVRLSVEKYCSVGATLQAGAPIRHEAIVGAG